MDYVVCTPYPQDVSRCLEQSPEVQVMATPLLTPLYPSHCLPSLVEVLPAQPTQGLCTCSPSILGHSVLVFIQSGSNSPP